MRRRAFLRAGVAAPAALLAGCPFTFEQGFLGECRAPHVPGMATAIVRSAWHGIRAANVWDVHAHLFGDGRSGSGIWLDPELDRPSGVVARARRIFFLNAGCVGDEGRLDEGMVLRMIQLVESLPAGVKLMLLAFDFTYDETGRQRKDLSTFYVPHEYVRKVAASRPERFEWIASVHPYRADAVEALGAAKAGGARAVKWLPPAMGIDLAHARCKPFYDALVRLDLPLLVHVGEEQAVPGARRGDLASPLALRHPLGQGVRVIAAHCATLGESPDLEANANPDKAPSVPNFDLFARLMGERRYEKLLYGDISAVTQANRDRHLPALLARREWYPRLLNGSDYPLPGMMPLFSLRSMVSMGILDEALVPGLRQLRESNALLFDFALKRSLTKGGARFPVGVFETRSYFEKAAA